MDLEKSHPWDVSRREAKIAISASHGHLELFKVPYS